MSEMHFEKCSFVQMCSVAFPDASLNTTNGSFVSTTVSIHTFLGFSQTLASAISVMGIKSRILLMMYGSCE